jgi:hypothetical protein
MRLSIVLIALSTAGLVAFVPSAGAIDDCPLPNVASGTNFGGCDPGGGEDPGTLAVTVSTTPAATVGSPAWDDEDLTYTIQVANEGGLEDAVGVQLTSEITQGSATLVSSSASQGSCSGYTCNLGDIGAGELATVTLVVHPGAGTLKNRFTASSSTLAGDVQTQTSTIRSSTPTAAIDWSMPQRARDANNDGLIDAGPPPGGYTPSSWSVTLDACGSQPGHKTISQYRWEMQGLPEQVTSNCQHTITVPREAVYPTKLTVMLTDGSSVVANRDVKVVDRFIVVMGDSYASGEGTPQSFIHYGSGTVLSWPTWDDVRCHRSMYASSARAARILEQQDPHSSVTYLSRACSGATIAQGILGGYKGIEPPSASSPDLPPQIQQIRSLIGSARIDDLLISIGGNDAGFAKIIADCMLPGDCFSNTTLVNDFNTAIAGLGNTGYPAMRNAIEDGSTGLNADSTFITEYPDFTTDSSGNRCDAIGADILWPLSISKAESDWASGTVLATITNTLKSQVDAAKSAGLDWNYVGGVQDAWTKLGQYGHGYCVGDPGVRDPNRWVRTFKDSCDLQGPPAGYVLGAYYCHADTTTGQFHPNEAGYLAIGQRYVAALGPKQPALDPDPGSGGGDPGTGGGDPGSGGGDPGTGGGDPGTGGDDPGSGGDDPAGSGGDTGDLLDLPNGDPTGVGGNLPPDTPILGGTAGPKKKAGKCSKLRGKKRARCVARACNRYKGRSKKARLKHAACVKAVTRRR